MGSADRLHAIVDVACLLYTSDAADERSSVDFGGRRIIKKKNYRERIVAIMGTKRQDKRRD